MVVVVVVMIGFGGGAEPVSVDDVARPTGPTQPLRRAELRPEQGVYVYEGSGTDKLDVPPKEQAEGPTMPATVTHGENGCWTFRIDYSTNHWQTWDYCARDDGLSELGGMSYQRWDFTVLVQETTSTFECSETVVIKPDQEPGESWDQSCAGTSTGTDGTATSAGPYRFVGTEDLQIGDEVVAAHHYLRDRTMSGSQSGTEHADVWFSAESGMPLRNERSIEARTDTVIGEVTYTEEAEFRLTSLTPQR